MTYYDAEGNQVKKTDFVRKKGLRQDTYGLGSPVTRTHIGTSSAVSRPRISKATTSVM